jgi:hypothetical protein
MEAPVGKQRMRVTFKITKLLAEMQPDEFAKYLVDSFDISKDFFETMVVKYQNSSAEEYWAAIQSCMENLCWYCEGCTLSKHEKNWCCCGMDYGVNHEPEKILNTTMFLALMRMRHKYAPTSKDDTIYWRVARCIYWILDKKDPSVTEEMKDELKNIVSDYESFGAKPWHFVKAVNVNRRSSMMYTEEDYNRMA